MGIYSWYPDHGVEVGFKPTIQTGVEFNKCICQLLPNRECIPGLFCEKIDKSGGDLQLEDVGKLRQLWSDRGT